MECLSPRYNHWSGTGTGLALSAVCSAVPARARRLIFHCYDECYDGDENVRNRENLSNAVLILNKLLILNRIR
jgi:hypothetical protein